MRARAEAHGGDEQEEQASFVRVLSDVVGHNPDEQRRERDFHQDEQPRAAEIWGCGQRRPELDDVARERRALGCAEDVDADGGGDAVERVGDEGERAARARDGDLLASVLEGDPRHETDADAEHGGDSRPEECERVVFEADVEVPREREDGEQRAHGGKDGRDREVGRVGAEPDAAGENRGRDVDGGRAEQRVQRGGRATDDVEHVEPRAGEHPRRERADCVVRDGEVAFAEQIGDGAAGDEESEQIRERREREPLGENGHAGTGVAPEESLTDSGVRPLATPFPLWSRDGGIFTPAADGPSMDKAEFAATIDHTVLGPETTWDDAKAVLDAADEHGMNACIPPCFVAEAAEYTPDVTLATVIGFPHGQNTPAAKREEAIDADENGADELDMVINIGRLKAGDDDAVQRDIAEVVAATPLKVKVIIETALLTDDEKHRACEAAKEAGADMVKTSTGFADGGATIEDVELMSEYLPVKASGGVGNYEDAMAMLDAGAVRIGASSGVDIVSGHPDA